MKLTLIGFTILLLFGGLLPRSAAAQDMAAELARTKKTLSSIQLELLQLQDAVDDVLRSRAGVEERLNAQVQGLSKLNENLTQQVEALSLQTAAQTEQLALYLKKSATAQIAEMTKVLNVLLLSGIDENTQLEPYLLELVNEGSLDISTDLLLFYIAESKRKSGSLDDALGYFGALISDYNESPLLPNAVYKMALVLETMEENEQMVTLLEQLAEADPNGKYGQLAIRKLNALDASAPAAK